MNLQTLSHNPRHLITKISPVIYDPNAKCPRWDQFMLEIFDNDAQMVDYLHRALGYSMTGLTTEQCWFFLYGTGANGKSTMLEVVHHVLGTYAVNCNITTFLQRSNDAIRSDLARLQGARFISLQETGNYSKLDLGLTKQFSAGDPITCRNLYGKEFSYKPEGKLWFHGNSKPIIRACDDGTFRRVRLVPYNRQFKGSEQDKNLAKKLILESSGILNRFLEGLAQFQRLGALCEPPPILKATADYRSAQDPLQDWIQDLCNTKNPLAETLQPDLFKSLIDYLALQGNPLDIHPKTFASMLDQKGFPRSRRTSQGWLRQGISLIDQPYAANPVANNNLYRDDDSQPF